MEFVREEMSGDWTKCSLLGGTQPRPDYAYGLSSACFNEEERVKIARFVDEIEERLGRLNKISHERSQVLKDLKDKVRPTYSSI